MTDESREEEVIGVCWCCGDELRESLSSMEPAVLVNNMTIEKLPLGCAFPGGTIVLTAVSDARTVLGAEEVACLQIGSSVSVIGGVSLI